MNALHIGLVQDSDHEIDRVLGTSGNYDLLGIAFDGASRLKIVADDLSQFDHAARVAIAKMTCFQTPKRAGARFAPQFHGSRVDQGAAEVDGHEAVLLAQEL